MLAGEHRGENPIAEVRCNSQNVRVGADAHALHEPTGPR